MPRSSISYDALLLRSVLLFPLLLPCALGAQAPAGDPPPPAAAEDLDSRLLEAELLELGEGKVDEAVAIYRELLAREDLAGALRARTLFALARAHRKRGELGAAKERYEELVANHAAETKLVEAAQKYLAEIADGAARLPEFDWVTQVEQSPEIQAQIFQWGMQLVEQGEEGRKAAADARRKLLSLGTMVIPVLEPMLENSRDSWHRHELARVLIDLGRVAYLPELVRIGDSDDIETISRALEDQPAEIRRSAIQSLAEMPTADGSREQWIATTARLELGDVSRVEQDLRIWAKVMDRSYQSRSFRYRPEVVQRMQPLLREVAESSFEAYLAMLESILREAPELLRREDLEPLRTSQESSNLGSFVLRLLYEKRREDLLWLLEGPEAPRLVQGLSIEEFSWSRWNDADWQLLGEDVPAVQKARIHRACGMYNHLLAIALADDSAVPILEEHLLRYELAPQISDWPRHDTGPFRTDSWHQKMNSEGRAARGRGGRPTRAKSATTPSLDPPKISESLETSLREVFSRADDPRIAGFALELLARAFPEKRPETIELFRRVLDDASMNRCHQMVAFVGLLLRLPDSSDREGDLDRLDRCFVGASEPDWFAPCSELDERGNSFWTMGSTVFNQGSLLPEGLLYYFQYLEPFDQANWIRSRVVRALLLAVGRWQALALPRALVSQGGRFGLRERSLFDRELAEVVEHIDDPETLRGLSSEVFDLAFRLDSPPVGAWTRLFMDPEVLVQTRQQFLFSLLSNPTDQGPRRAFLDGLDWRSILLGDDPLAAALLDHLQSHRYFAPFRVDARRSPQIEVQRWAWQDAPLPDRIEELEPALTSPDDEVRALGYTCLMLAEDTTWLPALHKAVEVAPTKYRLEAIEKLAFFAAPESLPVLTKRLDDPVFAVRTASLDALERIEETIAQREKWKERYGGKAPKAGNR